MACLQHANVEVGAVQPVDEVAERLEGSSVPLIVDATAAAGLVPLPRRWDLLAADATSWGGPSGVGVLVRRTGVRWRSPLPLLDDTLGAGPAGHPPVPLIAAAATALEDAQRWRVAEMGRLEHLVGALRHDLAELPDVEVHVAGPRLPHLLSLSALYVDGEALLLGLSRRGFSVHSGSACTSDTRRPSHVLAAMGALTQGNVRVSLPPGCEEGTVASFTAALTDEIVRLRAEAGLP